MLPLVFAYFLIFGLVYRYRMLYCLEQPKGQSLGGQAFPVAIYHTFVGLYVAELVLFAIFLALQDVALIVLSIILILLTMLINRYLHAAFRQVTRYLPAEFSEGMQRKVAAVYASTPLSGSHVSLPSGTQPRGSGPEGLGEGVGEKSMGLPEADESGWPSAVMPSRLTIPDSSRLDQTGLGPRGVLDGADGMGRGPGGHGGDEEEEEEDEGRLGRMRGEWGTGYYMAPEFHVPTPVIWLPQTTHVGQVGASEPSPAKDLEGAKEVPQAGKEVEALNALGIQATCEGAYFDEKRKKIHVEPVFDPDLLGGSSLLSNPILPPAITSSASTASSNSSEGPDHPGDQVVVVEEGGLSSGHADKPTKLFSLWGRDRKRQSITIISFLKLPLGMESRLDTSPSKGDLMEMSIRHTRFPMEGLENRKGSTLGDTPAFPPAPNDGFLFLHPMCWMYAI
ncbi:hypothetical protein BJ684DRAFT_18089 [Piptocephalis cylindrospora]|uniref:CSC1/OSCA1-like 7TM region domain-containing protein n=1 Tax=Piptocephalis cylindrospora TaxID=1907219 RepID=A0A4P9XY62_9FUNG|nr:hypothetical protein BJ684DRAFT_18089 [Piptocephalis cylindrospora]|eukprot:RKP11307.1 hypothetical protein BJ684DRAFT_18089 [Piptocephalis cylindrospora]